MLLTNQTIQRVVAELDMALKELGSDLWIATLSIKTNRKPKWEAGSSDQEQKGKVEATVTVIVLVTVHLHIMDMVQS